MMSKLLTFLSRIPLGGGMGLTLPRVGLVPMHISDCLRGMGGGTLPEDDEPRLITRRLMTGEVGGDEAITVVGSDFLAIVEVGFVTGGGGLLSSLVSLKLQPDCFSFPTIGF